MHVAAGRRRSLKSIRHCHHHPSRSGCPTVPPAAGGGRVFGHSHRDIPAFPAALRPPWLLTVNDSDTRGTRTDIRFGCLRTDRWKAESHLSRHSAFPDRRTGTTTYRPQKPVQSLNRDLASGQPHRWHRRQSRRRRPRRPLALRLFRALSQQRPAVHWSANRHGR
jgi:hypothetical protein